MFNPLYLLHSLFHIEENNALSNMIIAVGVAAFGEFITANVNSTIGSAVCVATWIFILRALFTVNFDRGKELGSVKILVIMLLLWNVFMVVYGAFTNPPRESSTYYMIKRLLTDKFFFLPMLFPLIVFFKNKNISLRFLFYWLSVFGIIYLILSPWALYSMTHWSFDYSLGYYGDENGENGYGNFISNSTRHISVFLPVVLAYYCKKYLSPRCWKFFICTALIGLFTQIYMARRGGAVMSLAYFFVAYWVYFRRSKHAGKRIIQISLLLLSVGGGYFLLTNFSDSVFSLLVERGMQDTRLSVEDNMIADFNKTPLDWWIGRGLWGTYYDSNFDNSLSLIKGHRWNVETGYLTMIMHGGYIYLGLYLSILLYAGFKGLFAGKNILVNSFGAIILMTILDLYPFGLQTFNFLYLVVWIGVYVCSQSYYRNMNDEQIYKQFFAPRRNSRYNQLLNKIIKLQK